MPEYKVSNISCRYPDSVYMGVGWGASVILLKDM